MRELPEAEYMKIRNYVLNMVYRAGQESILIPSSRELAAQFCVARATATKALNLLIEEKYLIPKKGVGTFSNPQMISLGAPFRVVGFLIGGGKNLFQDYSAWRYPALAGLELTKNGYFVREIRLTGIDTPERIESEIRSQMLDGLIYIGNSCETVSIMEKLAEEGMAVTGTFSSSKIRTSDIDNQSGGRDVGKLLFQEGRKRIAVYASGLKGLAEGIRQACEENDVEYLPFDSPHDVESFLRNEPAPDVLCITGGYDCRFMDIMDEIGLDYREKCRLVSSIPTVVDPRFCGYHCISPETEISDNLAKDLIEMMNGMKLNPGKTLFPLQIKTIDL